MSDFLDYRPQDNNTFDFLPVHAHAVLPGLVESLWIFSFSALRSFVTGLCGGSYGVRGGGWGWGVIDRG